MKRALLLFAAAALVSMASAYPRIVMGELVTSAL